MCALSGWFHGRLPRRRVSIPALVPADGVAGEAGATCWVGSLPRPGRSQQVGQADGLRQRCPWSAAGECIAYIPVIIACTAPAAGHPFGGRLIAGAAGEPGRSAASGAAAGRRCGGSGVSTSATATLLPRDAGCDDDPRHPVAESDGRNEFDHLAVVAERRSTRQERAVGDLQLACHLEREPKCRTLRRLEQVILIARCSGVAQRLGLRRAATQRQQHRRQRQLRAQRPDQMIPAASPWRAVPELPVEVQQHAAAPRAVRPGDRFRAGRIDRRGGNLGGSPGFIPTRRSVAAFR